MEHFNSPFTEQCCPHRYSAVSLSSIPSFVFYQEQEGMKGEKGWGLGCVWYTAVVWKKVRPLQDHYQSCGTTVIKTWMSLRGCRPQSIFHRSLGPSLLIDRSPGAAAPFCKARCIITQQNHIFNICGNSWAACSGTNYTLKISRETKNRLPFKINTLQKKYTLLFCCSIVSVSTIMLSVWQLRLIWIKLLDCLFDYVLYNECFSFFPLH